jgi:hypothetical protein
LPVLTISFGRALLKQVFEENVKTGPETCPQPACRRNRFGTQVMNHVPYPFHITGQLPHFITDVLDRSGEGCHIVRHSVDVVGNDSETNQVPVDLAYSFSEALVHCFQDPVSRFHGFSNPQNEPDKKNDECDEGRRYKPEQHYVCCHSLIPPQGI